MGQLPAQLLQLLLIRAGIEQNPGPDIWPCTICSKFLPEYSTAILCTSCFGWLHVKCSGLKTSKERKKYNHWTGPCCTHPSSKTSNNSPISSTSSSIPSATPSISSVSSSITSTLPTTSSNPPPKTSTRQPILSTSTSTNPPSSSSPPSSPPHPSTTTIPQQPPDSNNTNLNLLQINLNGIKGKISELLHLMSTNNIHIAAIQETKLTEKSNINVTQDYKLIRKDRGRNKGGGLAFIIHHSINFDKLATPDSLKDDPHLEELSISIPGQENTLHFRNIYIPPVSSCGQDYTPPINNIFDNLGDTAIVVGDINAHHQNWLNSASDDARGNLISDKIQNSNFGILNEDTPTRVTSNCSSSPDISLATSSILPSCTWSTKISLGSDHLPIFISLSTNIKTTKAPKRTFINFEKADWPGFTEYTEKRFNRLRPAKNIDKGVKNFNSILQEAAIKFIPAGRIPDIIHEMPTDAVRLMKTRDDLRTQDPSSIRLAELNRDIETLSDNHKTKKYREHLQKCKRGTKELWQTIKSANNSPQEPQNEGLQFGNKTFYSPSDIAKKLNQQFTPPATTKPTIAFRATKRKLEKTKDPKYQITEEMVKIAIKKSKKSKALGPDDISPLMMHYIGQAGIRYLTRLYNMSVNSGVVPQIWRTARIIPLPKPGKPTNLGKNKQPISLLAPPVKILESIILKPLTESINLADHQHGFRKKHSTVTALNEFSDHVTKGLNQQKPVERTVAVAIDLSRAFDTVNHEILLKDILDLNLNGRIKRFLKSYLSGRQTYVEYKGVKSKCRKMIQGVPQGGVLSPILFNLYMSTMPQPSGTIKLVTYADDGTALNSGTKIEPICQELNVYLEDLNQWFKGRNLSISAEKSSATLFTTARYECNTELPIYLNGEKVPSVKQPKILGVIFDNLFSFNHHTKHIKEKLQKRNNLLKALTGTSWGKEKEVITDTYKALGQSVLNYGCPIWSPGLKDSNWKQLQTLQNSALRTATGCVLMTPIHHLHTETKILPVKEHCTMLSKQFLLTKHLPEHPNHRNLPPDYPERVMKETLETENGTEIRDLIPPTGLNELNFKSKIKHIHTDTVRNTLRARPNNGVLNARPPEIDTSEATLPRKTRTTLAQLRSGYSTHLNSYMSRIREDTPDTCQLCGLGPHDTRHLFSCTEKPTTLTPKDLWIKPREVAAFLGLDTDTTADENNPD